LLVNNLFWIAQRFERAPTPTLRAGLLRGLRVASAHGLRAACGDFSRLAESNDIPALQRTFFS